MRAVLGGAAANTTIMEPLGLRRGEVVVAASDPRWPRLFEAAATELRRTLGTAILDVHHVGSTSVPGLCAKPILDILVSVPNFARAVHLASQLGTLGYEFRPEEEIPDRHYFRRPPGDELRTHHLSLAEPDSRHHQATLAFRDALRRDEALAQSYARLKEALARRFPHDRLAYLEGKSQFVMEVLKSVGLA